MAFVKKLKFKFLLSLVFAAIVFAILTMYADSSNLFLAFKKAVKMYIQRSVQDKYITIINIMNLAVIDKGASK